MKMFRKDEGFTLVELMVVVLIIGILVAIAVPVFLNASANAAAKSCQANQRTLIGAIATLNSNSGTPLITTAASGEVTITGSYAPLFATATQVVKDVPVCPSGVAPANTYVGTGTSITSDKGASGTTFVVDHKLP